MLEYISIERKAFDNWFFFINNNGIFNKLLNHKFNNSNLYEHICLEYYKNKKENNFKSIEDEYTMLLKTIGVTIVNPYGDGSNKGYEYASSLIAVNFLKTLFPVNSDSITKILHDISSQNLTPTEVKEKPLSNGEVYFILGLEGSGKLHVKKSINSICYVDDEINKFPKRKFMLQKLNSKIVYTKVWRDYTELVENSNSKKVIDSIRTFNYPKSNEYDEFIHLII